MITTFLAVALLAYPQAETCVEAMGREWPGLVETQREEPGGEVVMAFADGSDSRQAPRASGRQMAALAAMQRLEALCAGDAEASARLRSLDAALRVGLEDYAGAFALFERVSLDPASPFVGFDAPNQLAAAAGLRDSARFLRTRAAVRAAHDTAMLRLGWTRAMRFGTPLAEVDGYRAAGRRPAWVLIAWPGEGSMPATLIIQSVRYTDTAAPTLEARLYTCSVSDEVDTGGAGPNPSDAEVQAIATKLFAQPGGLSPGIPWMSDEKEDPQLALARLKEVPRPGCTDSDHVLPAFAQAARFTGLEYAADRSRLTEAQLGAMLVGSTPQQEEAAAYVFAHPDAANPFALLQPIGQLMRRGDMLQASFWFYFWQIRAIPWAKFGPPDGYGAVRASINSMIGKEINTWLGSDADAMRDVATRAMDYERRAPLYAGRPDGVSEAIWAKAIEESRAAYAKGYADVVRDPAAFRRMMTEGRSKNGLYNGPLRNPGKPLAEEWR